jgi:CDGSH-type Zn-finger protein
LKGPPAVEEIAGARGRRQHGDLVSEPSKRLRCSVHVRVDLMWLRPREWRDEADAEAHGRASLDECFDNLARPDARSGESGVAHARTRRSRETTHLARWWLGYSRRVNDVEIKVRANGPYKITGPVTLVDAEGRPFVIPEGSAIVLCRCGHSENKPFCDKSHRRVGFVADDSAPRIPG